MGPGKQRHPVLSDQKDDTPPAWQLSDATRFLAELHVGSISSLVSDGIIIVDLQETVIAMNQMAEQITGMQASATIGKPYHKSALIGTKSDQCPLLDSLRNGVVIHQRSYTMLGSEGHIFPATVSSGPLLNGDGQRVGAIMAFHDDTQRLQTALILDSIADGVFTVDRNYRITSFNHAAETITGWPRQKAIGQYCSDIFQSSICGRECAIAESLYSCGAVTNRSITIKTFHGETTPVSISTAPLLDHEGNVVGGVETFRDVTVEQSLRSQLLKNFTFETIISKSPSMQRLFQILPDIAKSDSTVLILGESGTGKELIARAIYNGSNRANEPFVAVNCGALPETLLESELFGYKAGAFTDAKKDKIGRFAAAEGGTIFLDEIGDIPTALQVKLLRVLQHKLYEPLGSNTPVAANVRILAATNRDLGRLVEEGGFRDDLFYRLNVANITLPPLRERIEDIPLLIDHFVGKFRAEKQKDIVGVSDEVLSFLMRYSFPGNIRELENIIEYGFILCQGGQIQVNHLPDSLTTEFSKHRKGGRHTNQTLAEIERQAILTALEQHDGKRMKVCRQLGISKDTLRRKLAGYGVVWD